MATSFITKKQRIYAEARKKDAKPMLKKLAAALKNFGTLAADQKADLKELVDAIYTKLVEKPMPTKKGETAKPTKKPSRSISQILKDFKAKIGLEKWKEATRGTDIYRDMERPALKKGKRIVSKRGKTSNQYGTFKNQVGSVYYENRANRFDVNKKYPKLADGGKVGEMIDVINSGWIYDNYGRGLETLEEAKTYANKAVKRNSSIYKGHPLENADAIVVEENGKYYVLMRPKNYVVQKKMAKRVYSDGGEFGGGGQVEWVVNFSSGDDYQTKYVKAKSESQAIHKGFMAISNDGENSDDYSVASVYKSKMVDGGRTGKKRIKRRKVTRQNANYDKKADSGLVAKPQGHRFTDKLAKRLGKPSYAKPTKEQIEKYRGKGVYSENRQDKSDVNPKRTYPSL